jgi:hypothetical protein
MAKKDLSFDFGFNVKPKGGKKPKPRAQDRTTRQAYAIARRKGGELHGRSGS